MSNFLNFRIIHFFYNCLFLLTSCKTIENLPGGDARENPPDPRERVKKNLEEGRGFRLDDALSRVVMEKVVISCLQAQMNFGEHP